jgi:hypothetical protein
MIAVCRCRGGSASVVHPPSWREVSSVGTSPATMMILGSSDDKAPALAHHVSTAQSCHSGAVSPPALRRCFTLKMQPSLA